MPAGLSYEPKRLAVAIAHSSRKDLARPRRSTSSFSEREDSGGSAAFSWEASRRPYFIAFVGRW